MPITSLKITAFQKLIAALADHPNATMSASELKSYFDSSPEELRQAINTLIDNLFSTVPGNSGAENIGSAPITGVTGSTVYAQITDLKSQLTNIILGQIPDGTITEAKLAFNIATQAEMDAAIIGSTMYTYKNMGGF